MNILKFLFVFICIFMPSQSFAANAQSFELPGVGKLLKTCTAAILTFTNSHAYNLPGPDKLNQSLLRDLSHYRDNTINMANALLEARKNPGSDATAVDYEKIIYQHLQKKKTIVQELSQQEETSIRNFLIYCFTKYTESAYFHPPSTSLAIAESLKTVPTQILRLNAFPNNLLPLVRGVHDPIEIHLATCITAKELHDLIHKHNEPEIEHET